MWKQKQPSIYYQNLKNKVLFIRKKDLSVFKKKRKFRLFIAYNLSRVRLIDNY